MRQYVDFFVVRWPCTVHTLTMIVPNLSPSKEFIIEIKTCVNVGTVQLDIFFIWHVEVFTCEDFGVLGPHRKIKPTLVQIVQKQDNFGFFGTKEMIRIRFCHRLFPLLLHRKYPLARLRFYGAIPITFNKVILYENMLR